MVLRNLLRQGTVIPPFWTDGHLCSCVFFPPCHSLSDKNNLCNQLFASFQQEETNISQYISRFAHAPDRQWLQLNILFTLGTGSIHCKGIFSQNEFDYCKSGTTHTLEYMCLELQFCASSICCSNSFDNVLFLSGILPQEVKEMFVPRRHGTDCPHSGCLHFMNSSFHFPQELHWRGGIIANFFTAQSF